ncbi:MAG: hypothetical protein WC967_09810 [Balneolaceae bacterium]
MKPKNNISPQIDALLKQAESLPKISTSSSFMSNLNQKLDRLEQPQVVAPIHRLNLMAKYAAVVAIVIINLGILFSVVNNNITESPSTDVISQFTDEYFPEYTALFDGEQE